MGSESIDIGLKNIVQTWSIFKRGKRFTSDLCEFQYNLEKNLYGLYKNLNEGTYRHGGYRKFIVNDNKRREISVASVHDRFVHRLIYDYLCPIYDKTFIYDVWSCRLGKGLLGGIERTQQFLKAYPEGFVWKGDIRKFFDSIDQETLLRILAMKIKDRKTYDLLKEVIRSFSSEQGMDRGMPIGNLTSQIFANIYLNELDRFVKHRLKSKAYLRYGDDFILIENDLSKLRIFRTETIDFLRDELKLEMNGKNDKIIKIRHGLKFLGVIIWPYNRTLNRRNFKRAQEKLKVNNVSSYCGLVKQHAEYKDMKYFNWFIQGDGTILCE